jgi:hypothetical protein
MELGERISMAPRRVDILSVSLRPDLIDLLKQEAARRSETVSALVRGWASTLADQKEQDENG